MKVGIKFGALDWQERLKKSNAKYAEVYFRLDWKEKYQELFQYLRENEIQFGLHFWALIKGKYCPNLAYSENGIAAETAKLIKETIDIASKNGAYYVNFHPESLKLVELNLDRQEFYTTNDPPISVEEGFRSLSYYCKELKQYGNNKNVKTYTETVPLHDPSNFRQGEITEGRMNPIMKYGMPTSKLIELGKMGFDICFDIAHAANQYPSDSREEIFEKTYQDAQDIAKYVKLVHVSTTVPPFNGTDSHNGVLEDDFSQNVFPSRDELLKIFKVFKKYPDIWYIPEPQMEKMVDNYFEIQKLLDEA
jgi:endonuclease IV